MLSDKLGGGGSSELTPTQPPPCPMIRHTLCSTTALPYQVKTTFPGPAQGPHTLCLLGPPDSLSCVQIYLLLLEASLLSHSHLHPHPQLPQNIYSSLMVSTFLWRVSSNLVQAHFNILWKCKCMCMREQFQPCLHWKSTLVEIPRKIH